MEDEKTVERVHLVSSHLDFFEYDEGNRELLIGFQDGSEYRYDDVPADVAQGLGNSASPGAFFKSYIKGRYNFYKEA